MCVCFANEWMGFCKYLDLKTLGALSCTLKLTNEKLAKALMWEKHKFLENEEALQQEEDEYEFWEARRFDAYVYGGY